MLIHIIWTTLVPLVSINCGGDNDRVSVVTGAILSPSVCLWKYLPLQRCASLSIYATWMGWEPMVSPFQYTTDSTFGWMKPDMIDLNAMSSVLGTCCYRGDPREDKCIVLNNTGVMTTSKHMKRKHGL